MDKLSQTLLVIFVAVAAISILMQAGFTVAMFLASRTALKKAIALADDLRLHILPVIISSRELIQDLSPNVKAISANLTAVSTTVRSRTEQVGGLVGNVTERASVQASRVDGMVKSTLDQLTFAAQAIEHGIAVPVRQVNGILNGLRAGIEVIKKKDVRNPLDAEDEDLFV